jgi:hypothetical protein
MDDPRTIGCCHRRTSLCCDLEIPTDSAVQIVAVTAEWLVDSIDGLTQGGGITKEFVGVILLPIVGNAAGLSQTAACLDCSQLA